MFFGIELSRVDINVKNSFSMMFILKYFYGNEKNMSEIALQYPQGFKKKVIVKCIDVQYKG